MRELDLQMAQALIAEHEAAAERTRAAIAAAAGGGQRVELARLRALLATVEATIDTLARERDALLLRGVRAAAELGARPLTAPGLAVASGASAAAPAVLDGAQALQVVDEAVTFVRTWRDAGGLVLSDRLWRIDRGARELLGRAIEQAVVQGWSADRAAEELVQRGVLIDEPTRRAQKAAEVGQVQRAGDLLASDRQDPLAASLRVMRTELSRAHGEAYMASAQRSPGFAGFRYLLSPQHPKPDICDLLSVQNLHGLGAGVYPDRASTPWPAHPNTLSFVAAVFVDEISAEDRAGRETTTQALARMAPELRAAVLGPTKATYFDRGVLTRGMVRAPVGAVRARLARQGRA
jgi:hypothetical protein